MRDEGGDEMGHDEIYVFDDKSETSDIWNCPKIKRKTKKMKRKRAKEKIIHTIEKNELRKIDLKTVVLARVPRPQRRSVLDRCFHFEIRTLIA